MNLGFLDNLAFTEINTMASPHVAVTAALYLSSNPKATPAQVLAALKENKKTFPSHSGLWKANLNGLGKENTASLD